MLGHDDVADHVEPVAATGLFEGAFEDWLRARVCVEERLPTIAAEGEEVQPAGILVALEPQGMLRDYDSVDVGSVTVDTCACVPQQDTWWILWVSVQIGCPTRAGVARVGLFGSGTTVVWFDNENLHSARELESLYPERKTPPRQKKAGWGTLSCKFIAINKLTGWATRPADDNS